jgi:spore coat polysaccharide biosynthesis protein SpsF
MRSIRKVVGIVQARMGSKRLPGKSMAPLLGRPMLGVLLERVKPARRVSKWIVATSELPIDDPIVELTRRLGMGCFRGSETDCLDRYYQASRQASADVVVRITGDNPLLEAAFVDWSLEHFLRSSSQVEYMDSSSSNTFPLGLSLEVFSFSALRAAWQEDCSPHTREHVTPFIRQHPNRFPAGVLHADADYSSMRWTVDTAADLEFVRTLFESFGQVSFSWSDALKRVQQHPEWLEINRHVVQRTV